jgi:hypothetical protein
VNSNVRSLINLLQRHGYLTQKHQVPPKKERNEKVLNSGVASAKIVNRMKKKVLNKLRNGSII